MTTTRDSELSLAQAARRVLPAGNLGNMTGDTIIREGRGGRVWDVGGQEYVDFLLGSGPMLVGHAHPLVTSAVQEQLARGTTFFANNEYAILLAEAIVDAVACADKVRFTSSGTEADAYAMRLARAYRRRDKILKFEGGYHGMSDYALMSLWPTRLANFPQPVPDSAGIPRSVRDDILICPFNDLESAQDLIREYQDDLAGVIVEPMQRLVPPKPGFLEGLREATSKYGVLLIFDEVVTGFRLAYGGAQEYYGVVPDVCTLGKVIGGGFPLAAVAGTDKIMAHFDRSSVGDEAFLPQVGTLSGNPVAAVAGLETLKILQGSGAYDKIFATGEKIRDALLQALKAAGVSAQVVGEPPMFDAIFTAEDIVDYRGTLKGDVALSKRFNTLLRERGVFKGEGKMYISLAHDAADIDVASAAFRSAAQQLEPALVRAPT